MKRFTETLKWSKPWFRQLPPKHKLLWQWMCDTCDNAGILDADWGLASFQIGCAFTAADLDAFDGRATILPCGKVWIPSFITFQCSTLSRDCKAHGPIFASLEKHGINPETMTPIGYPIGYAESSNRVCNTHKEKEKETEKEKAKEKEKSTAKAKSPEEVEEFALSLGCPAGQGAAAYWKWEGNGWVNGKAAIKDWRATVRAWKAQGYAPFISEAPAKAAPKSFAQIDREEKEASRHGAVTIKAKVLTLEG